MRGEVTDVVFPARSGERSSASQPAGGAGGTGETPAADRAAPALPVDFYDVVHRRRDVRGQFTGAPIPPGALERVLTAAHAAPSVGLSQPWDFVVVSDPVIRRAFFDHVQEERRVFADSLSGEAAERFSRIKIDGVLEATLSIVVTYDPTRGAPSVLGRHAIDDAGLYSVCLSIENLWLAATVEGLGVGWVSFYRETFLAGLIGLPEAVRPVAWLCLGPVTHLETVPDLERQGWRSRVPLSAVVHRDTWGSQGSGRDVGGGTRDAASLADREQGSNDEHGSPAGQR